MQSSPPLATTSSATMLGVVLLDACAGAVVLLALARLARTPRHWFSWGLVSKFLWALVSIWWTWHAGDFVLPAGAAVALWHLRSLWKHHAGEEPPELPFARGGRGRGEDGR